MRAATQSWLRTGASHSWTLLARRGVRAGLPDDRDWNIATSVCRRRCRLGVPRDVTSDTLASGGSWRRIPEDQATACRRGEPAATVRARPATTWLSARDRAIAAA